MNVFIWDALDLLLNLDAVFVTAAQCFFGVLYFHLEADEIDEQILFDYLVCLAESLGVDDHVLTSSLLPAFHLLLVGFS